MDAMGSTARLFDEVKSEIPGATDRFYRHVLERIRRRAGCLMPKSLLGMMQLDDFVQESLIRSLKHLGKVSTVPQFFKGIHTIMWKLAAERLRHLKVHTRAFPPVSPPDPARGDSARPADKAREGRPPFDPPAADSSPSARAARREQFEILLSGLRALPLVDRVIVEMTYLESCEAKEIAPALVQRTAVAAAMEVIAADIEGKAPAAVPVLREDCVDAAVVADILEKELERADLAGVIRNMMAAGTIGAPRSSTLSASAIHRRLSRAREKLLAGQVGSSDDRPGQLMHP